MLTWLIENRIAFAQPDADAPSFAREILAAVLRDERRRHQRPRAGVAFASDAARRPPTVKDARGPGRACQRVVVAGTSLAVMPMIERTPQPKAVVP